MHRWGCLCMCVCNRIDWGGEFDLDIKGSRMPGKLNFIWGLVLSKQFWGAAQGRRCLRDSHGLQREAPLHFRQNRSFFTCFIYGVLLDFIWQKVSTAKASKQIKKLQPIGSLKDFLLGRRRKNPLKETLCMGGVRGQRPDGWLWEQESFIQLPGRIKT